MKEKLGRIWKIGNSGYGVQMNLEKDKVIVWNVKSKTKFGEMKIPEVFEHSGDLENSEGEKIDRYYVSQIRCFINDYKMACVW